MVKMKDVAKEAGVSIGTVSAVVNGSKTVKPQNIEKVEAACEKLGFMPNLVARTLRTGSSKGIGLLIPDITNPYYPELARGVEDAAYHLAYNVFLCNNDRNESKERNYINFLLSKNVDGIIMVKPLVPVEELKRIQLLCRLVILDPSNTPLHEFDTIVANNASGTRQAMEALLCHGHRHIGYISGSMDSVSAQERFDTYLKVLKENGIEKDDRIIRHKVYSWDGGYEAGNEILDEPNQPTAIFAANDMIALGCIKALTERGVNVPRDISVVGFDDIALATYGTPSLSTVRVPKYEMGKRGVDILIQRRDEPKGYRESALARFETEYIERESVSGPP